MNSKLFDSIRIKSRSPKKDKPEGPPCDWEGCDQPGTHKAPKNQRQNGEYFNFCIEHVRHYNKSFNFFAEMEDGDIDAVLRRSAENGERPTWGMGANAHGRGNPRPRAARAKDFSARRVNDPHNFFAKMAHRTQARPMSQKELRMLEADRRALETLGLEGRKSSVEIKTAYKALVKIHHPDANGGDRSSEERLRAIIAAYNHLKQKGFVS